MHIPALVVALVGWALLLTSATAAPASDVGAQAGCGTVAGPNWEDQAFGKSGNRWVVTAKGVTCKSAKQWSTKLAKTLWRGEAGTKLRGPAGWNCLPTFASTVSTKGTPGSCRKGGKLFYWAPKV